MDTERLWAHYAVMARDSFWELVRQNNRLRTYLITRETLNRPRPRNISEADWRMALRRKLNGDTR